MINETAILNVAFNAEHISLYEFELETFDDRHELEFEGKLSDWWDKFWRYFATTVAISSSSIIANKRSSGGRVKEENGKL